MYAAYIDKRQCKARAYRLTRNWCICVHVLYLVHKTDGASPPCDKAVVAGKSSTCGSIGEATDSIGVKEAVAKIGQGKVSKDMQMMLAANPIYTGIVSEGKAKVVVSKFEGKPSIVLMIDKVSPAVRSALTSPGHPNLKFFVSASSLGEAASLVVTLVPDWFGDQASSGLVISVATSKGAPIAPNARMKPVKTYWRTTTVIGRSDAYLKYKY